MSRARSITVGGEEIWFDTNQDGRPATGEQLELLADLSGRDIDDLLDTSVSQGQAILALREALTPGQVVPARVLEAKRDRRAAAQRRPECRICKVVGKSDRHHFIPRWMMRELENYDAYSSRSICCIPLCINCHRELHNRSTDEPGKSIVPYLRPYEADLAQRILDDFREQHPHGFDLIAGGDGYTYEHVLIQDYIGGEFSKLAASDSIISIETPERATAIL